MIPLTELWLPILVAAVLVFMASSIIHMVLPIHRNDYKRLPGEAQILAALRAQSIPPEVYRFPFATMDEMNKPEVIEKYRQGPVGLITIVPNNTPQIGKSLALWFLYTVMIGIFVAYVAAVGLERGVAYLTVFRVTGAAAVLGYALIPIPEAIWRGQPWPYTLKFVIDGVIYALLTAGTFGWLWPDPGT